METQLQNYLPYKVSTHNSFKKGIRKLDAQFKETVIEHCNSIQQDPSVGENMHGNFKKLDIKKTSVKNTTPEFRILYKVYSCTDKNIRTLRCSKGVQHADVGELERCDGLVDYIICGTREMFNNFYKLPLDKLKKYI